MWATLSPVLSCSQNDRARKIQNLVMLPILDPGNWRWTLLASGDWLRTLSLSLRDKCVSRKEPFPRWKESGESFPLALRKREEPFRQPSQKWLQNWYVISIKMNGKLIQLYIGIRWDQYYWGRSQTRERTYFRNKNGYPAHPSRK